MYQPFNVYIYYIHILCNFVTTVSGADVSMVRVVRAKRDIDETRTRTRPK